MEDDIKVNINKIGWEVDGCGSGLYPVVEFCVSSIEPFGSISRELVSQSVFYLLSYSYFVCYVLAQLLCFFCMKSVNIEGVMSVFLSSCFTCKSAAHIFTKLCIKRFMLKSSYEVNFGLYESNISPSIYEAQISLYWFSQKQLIQNTGMVYDKTYTL
jgi:hypothetical protein